MNGHETEMKLCQPHVPVKELRLSNTECCTEPRSFFSGLWKPRKAQGCPWAARCPCTTVMTFHGCTEGELCIYNTAEQKLNINSMKSRSSSLTTRTKGVTLGLGCLLYVLKSPEWDELHQTHLKSHKLWDTDFLRTPAPSDWCTDTVSSTGASICIQGLCTPLAQQHQALEALTPGISSSENTHLLICVYYVPSTGQFSYLCWQLGLLEFQESPKQPFAL